LAPPPVSLTDAPGFLLRWSKAWYERSLDHLCAVWGLDREHDEWASHSQYRIKVRRSVPTPWKSANVALMTAATPIEQLVASRDTPRHRLPA
jgi:hypothetical protein